MDGSDIWPIDSLEWRIITLCILLIIPFVGDSTTLWLSIERTVSVSIHYDNDCLYAILTDMYLGNY